MTRGWIFLAVLVACSVLYGPVSGQSASLMFLGGPNGASPANQVMLINFPVATTLTGRNTSGALTAEKTSRFTVVSAPAAASQGTASIAAEASVRHVADCVIWSADASAAVTAAAGTLVLRDGATGAGTIIAQWRIAHQVAAGAGIQTIAPNSVCGLNLSGTTNTAMTAEFNAGVTGEEQAVTLTGFNVS